MSTLNKELKTQRQKRKKKLFSNCLYFNPHFVSPCLFSPFKILQWHSWKMNSTGKKSNQSSHILHKRQINYSKLCTNWRIYSIVMEWQINVIIGRGCLCLCSSSYLQWHVTHQCFNKSLKRSAANSKAITVIICIVFCFVFSNGNLHDSKMGHDGQLV